MIFDHTRYCLRKLSFKMDLSQEVNTGKNVWRQFYTPKIIAVTLSQSAYPVSTKVHAYTIYEDDYVNNLKLKLCHI